MGLAVDMNMNLASEMEAQLPTPTTGRTHHPDRFILFNLKFCLACLTLTAYSFPPARLSSYPNGLLLRPVWPILRRQE